MTTTRNETCTRRVFSGERSDMGGHMCPNRRKAGDPDGLCGLHRAAEVRKAAAAKGGQQYKPAEGIGTAEVRRTTTVTLKWPQGEGPVFVPRYHTQAVMMSYLRVKGDSDDPERDLGVSGVGALVRKDGTPSDAQRRELHSVTRLSDLPDELATMLHRRFVEALR